MLRELKEGTLSFLSDKVYLKRWEVAKYFLISALMFSPALLSFFNHIENEYYTRSDNLLSFVAFTSLAFTVMVVFNTPRKWTIPFLLAAIACDAYHIVFGKPIGFQTMAAMYETNSHEMMGFLLSPVSVPIILGGAAGAGAMIWYVVRDKPVWRLTGETRVKRSYLVVLTILAFALFIFEGKTILFTYPLDVFQTNYRYAKEANTRDDYLKNTYEIPGECSARLDKRPPEISMLIIGEAARRSSQHAYGYRLETTPQLDSFIAENPAKVVLFQNAISGSAYTRGSVPTLLSTFDLKEIDKLYQRPTLTKMFRGAGFATLYVTTRPKYLFPNIVSTFQDDAEEIRYLSRVGHKAYDMDTLSVMEDFLKRNKGRKRFAILHLMGSHIKYSMQYPKNEAFFHSGDKMLDSYNDTIRYSDKVLMGAVRLVMAADNPGFVLYASDHGENLDDFGDGNYGHGTRGFTHFEFEIPFEVFFNDAFLKLYPEKVALIRKRASLPICQDNISHTFLGLSGLTDHKYYNPAEDLSSAKFKTRKRFVIDENMNVYDYDELNLDAKKAKRRR